MVCIISKLFDENGDFNRSPALGTVCRTCQRYKHFRSLCKRKIYFELFLPSFPGCSTYGGACCFFSAVAGFFYDGDDDTRCCSQGYVFLYSEVSDALDVNED